MAEQEGCPYPGCKMNEMVPLIQEVHEVVVGFRVVGKIAKFALVIGTLATGTVAAMWSVFKTIS